ncbi:MAG: glycosyltransferase, partial [Euryarchaeota archaeon]|nr:glycosyltransferase [Euryarchaeota archaeon]
MDTNVSIIILNWNGWKDTIECLESLFQINYPNYDVIVVDNASKDESIEKIREYCEGQIKVNTNFFKYQRDNEPITIFEPIKNELENTEKLRKDYEDLPSNKKLILIKNDKN